MLSRPFDLFLFLLYASVTQGRSHRRPSSRSKPVQDPTNAPDSGELVNSARLVLKLDCPECPVNDLELNETWAGEDVSLIYDLNIFDGESDTIVWPPDETETPDVVRFFPPGSNLGSTPFTRSINLVGPPSLTVPDYLSGEFEPLIPAGVPGIVNGVGVANPYHWNITRVSFINGIVYSSGPGQEAADIPVALVYLFKNRTEPLEIVWWELQDVNDFQNDTSTPQLPVGLERRLLGKANGDWTYDDGHGKDGERHRGYPHWPHRNALSWMPWITFGLILFVLLIGGVVLVRSLVWLDKRRRTWWRRVEHQVGPINLDYVDGLEGERMLRI